MLLYLNEYHLMYNMVQQLLKVKIISSYVKGLTSTIIFR